MTYKWIGLVTKITKLLYTALEQQRDENSIKLNTKLYVLQTVLTQELTYTQLLRPEWLKTARILGLAIPFLRRFQSQLKGLRHL